MTTQNPTFLKQLLDMFLDTTSYVWLFLYSTGVVIILFLFFNFLFSIFEKSIFPQKNNLMKKIKVFVFSLLIGLYSLLITLIFYFVYCLFANKRIDSFFALLVGIYLAIYIGGFLFTTIIFRTLLLKLTNLSRSWRSLVESFFLGFSVITFSIFFDGTDFKIIDVFWFFSMFFIPSIGAFIFLERTLENLSRRDAKESQEAIGGNNGRK
jgi:hypothetical protein